VSDTELILVQPALTSGGDRTCISNSRARPTRNRANVVVDHCDDMMFKNLKVVGAKPAASGYNPGLEAQHGVDA